MVHHKRHKARKKRTTHKKHHKHAAHAATHLGTAGSKAAHHRRAATKKRSLSPGFDYAGCAVAAVMASLELVSGQRASAGEVRRLFVAAGGDDFDGVTIPSMLAAAVDGVVVGNHLARVTRFRLVELDEINSFISPLLLGLALPGAHTVLSVIRGSVQPLGLATSESRGWLDTPASGHGRIEYSATGWWSWGEWWDPADFPDAVVEEAWEVEWECLPH